MPVTLSRHALYDLVWSKPRTELAKEFGVSNVAINKHCLGADIPAPPPGYWTKLKLGRKVAQMPLPLRLPGRNCWVVIGQESRSHWRIPSKSEEALVPPAFLEDMEAQVAAATKRIGKVARTRDLGAPDPALSKLLAAEEKRRGPDKVWSYEKPHFDEPVFQRQLRLFNSLARAFRPLYGVQAVVSEDEWIRGFGTVHRLELCLNFGGVGMRLMFREPTDNKRLRDWSAVKTTTLEVGHKSDHGGIQRWADSEAGKLEDQLTEIMRCLLRRAEESFRAAAYARHEFMVQQREADRLAELARVRANEEQRRAVEAMRLERIREEIIGLAKRQAMANEIRTMVAALSRHPEAAGPQADDFRQWADHAMQVADSLDPLKASMTEILGSFEPAPPTE